MRSGGARPARRHAPSTMPGRAWDLQGKQVNAKNSPCRGTKQLKKKRDGRGPPARGGHGAGKPKIAGPSPCIRAVRLERGGKGGEAPARRLGSLRAGAAAGRGTTPGPAGAPPCHEPINTSSAGSEPRATSSKSRSKRTGRGDQPRTQTSKAPAASRGPCQHNYSKPRSCRGAGPSPQRGGPVSEREAKRACPPGCQPAARWLRMR